MLLSFSCFFFNAGSGAAAAGHASVSSVRRAGQCPVTYWPHSPFRGLACFAEVLFITFEIQDKRDRAIPSARREVEEAPFGAAGVLWSGACSPPGGGSRAF